MKTKILFCLLALICISVSQAWSQEFDLSTFSEDIEETMHKLEIGEREWDRSIEIYKDLSKSLLNLNEELIGTPVKEVEGLIEKKFDSANERFQEVLVKDQFIVVQNLNNKLMKQLIEGLIGTNGLIGTHGMVDEEGIISKKDGREQISIVVGTCIK